MTQTELIDEPLARHTTLRIGGPAERLIVPPDKDCFLDAVRTCVRTKTPYFVIGKGSNTLARDEGVKGIVVKNTSAFKELSIDGQRVKAGSSVTLQELIRFCVGNDLYGMEYLYSVPGNVGGAICMNAGRGAEFRQSISNHIVEVEIFDGELLRTLSRSDCRFGHRSSLFQKKRNWIILSVILILPFQDKTIGEQRIKERVSLVKEVHDLRYPSAGSVFKLNFKPLPEIVGHRIGNAQFSPKCPGWIINTGGATFKDVHNLIDYAVKVHKRHRLPVPELELYILPPRGPWQSLRDLLQVGFHKSLLQ